ncbi:response regulator [Piscinibacter gummiphilus]|uniref:Response regulator n=1 Tax=Piscinibacter gummiphilus TaxID=946333 RepID=A0ABZ0D000_9BURK|nr:response regulator [Piscinibacter gummiphilus]WOB08610.1 response regulator [Piscinibacter gummiphilus]
MNEGVRSYSTIEIAKRLGISLQTVQRWVDSGRLKAWKTPGGHRRIDAHSAELLFKAHEQTTGSGAAPDLGAAAEARPLQVVIVDDDAMDRELMSTLVQAALPHAQLRVAGNGFQGLVMIAKLAPDIVVTDVHMPHMDGFEMIRNVLADAQTRPKLMIAVSAKSPRELADFGQLPSEVLLLRKPLEREAFVAALRRT